jgi:hypothetical protein
MSEVKAENNFGLLNDKSLLEDGVEFIGSINKHGKFENILCENEINLTMGRKEMFSMGFRLQSSMQSDFDSEFGAVDYNLSVRERSKFVSMLYFPYIVLVIMKKNIDHLSVIEKIKKKIVKLEMKSSNC